MIEVTVIVPTFNRAHYLKYCLDSLLTQTLKPYQIIVIDDGSTDDTQLVANAYGNKIEYFYKDNGGKSSAINSIRDSIRGSHLWLFDDDDVATPTAIENLAYPHANDATLGYSFGYFIPASFEKSEISSYKVDRRTPSVVRHNQHCFDLTESNYIFLSSCLVRTDNFLKTGPFDERLIRSQDYDFLLRLTANCSFEYINRHVYWLREHHGARGSLSNRFSYADRNKEWIKYDKIVGSKLFKNYPRSAFLHPDLVNHSPLIRSRSTELRMAYIATTKSLLDNAKIYLHRAACTQDDSATPLHDLERQSINGIFGDHSFVDAMINQPSYRADIFESFRRLPNTNPNRLLSQRLYWNATSLFQRSEHRAGIRLLLESSRHWLGAWRND